MFHNNIYISETSVLICNSEPEFGHVTPDLRRDCLGGEGGPLNLSRGGRGGPLDPGRGEGVRSNVILTLLVCVGDVH